MNDTKHPGIGAIDIVVNIRTPKEFADGRVASDRSFQDKVRQNDSIRQGVEIEDYINIMDEAGVDRSLIIAARCGDMNIHGSTEIPYESVYEVCEKHPNRISGIAGVDTTKGVGQLRELEVAVRDFGFVGAHWYPHWFAMLPDAAQIYPVYEKCCELDIPIMMQVGQNLIYSQHRRLPSVGRPINIDRVAIDFPELRIIGIHLGTPWHSEMISMCWKHENVFMAGDAYAPKYWPEEVIHYGNTYGQDKLLFGTDFPVVDPRRAMKDLENHGLREIPKKKILRDNAIRIFKLTDTPVLCETLNP